MANAVTPGGGGSPMMGNYEMSKTDNCEQKLELHIKVDQLRNMDWVGQSDPFAVVYLNSQANGPRPKRKLEKKPSVGLKGAYERTMKSMAQRPVLPTAKFKFAQRKPPWEHVGTTEVVRNSLSASFSKAILINYFFERSQLIAIDVYDNDGPSNNVMDHDYLGSAELSVPALVRAEGKCLTLPLKMDQKPGIFCGNVTVIAENKGLRRFIAKMDIGVNIFQRPTMISSFGGPYLLISRQTSGTNSQWMVVYRSKQPGRRDKSWDKYAYVFQGISEGFELLSLGSDDTQLLFQVAFTVRSRDRIVAAAQMSLRQWMEAGHRFDLHRPVTVGTVIGRQTSKPKGEMRLRNYSVSQEPQFLDYILGGCEISLVIGIDFTASNGDSMQPSSLHFCDMFRPNEYELAIRTVGDILASYDSDSRFPAYGFGAKLPPNYTHAEHCFSLTGNEDPTCYEIDGVLDAYRQSLFNVRLSGPTEFGLLIQTAAKHARAEMQKYSQAYTILLIVTDGVINDFDETTRAIVEASLLPLSIVIIGVGDADFTAMDALDGDDIPLTNQRCRDIVQFVPFREYQRRPDMLVSKVLEEIPRQFVEYMMMNGIGPNPAKPAAMGTELTQAQAMANTGSPQPPIPNNLVNNNINVAADAVGEDDDFGRGGQASNAHYGSIQGSTHNGSYQQVGSAEGQTYNAHQKFDPAHGPPHHTAHQHGGVAEGQVHHTPQKFNSAQGPIQGSTHNGSYQQVGSTEGQTYNAHQKFDPAHGPPHHTAHQHGGAAERQIYHVPQQFNSAQGSPHVTAHQHGGASEGQIYHAPLQFNSARGPPHHTAHQHGRVAEGQTHHAPQQFNSSLGLPHHSAQHLGPAEGQIYHAPQHQFNAFFGPPDHMPHQQFSPTEGQAHSMHHQHFNPAQGQPHSSPRGHHGPPQAHMGMGGNAVPSEHVIDPSSIPIHAQHAEQEEVTQSGDQTTPNGVEQAQDNGASESHGTSAAYGSGNSGRGLLNGETSSKGAMAARPV